MRIIQFKDVVPGSSYDLLTSSFFRDHAVDTIIHYYRNWKNKQSTPFTKQQIFEPNDDGFYNHLSNCVAAQNFHQIDYNHPDFLRRLYGALRHNIVNMNDFLTIQLLYELIDCFNSGELPLNAKTQLSKYHLSDPLGPFKPHEKIRYWQSMHSKMFNLLINNQKHSDYMHYYTFEIPLPFILAFLYFAIGGPQYDVSYHNILKKVVQQANVNSSLIKECLQDIELLKFKPSEEISKKIKNFLSTSFPKMQQHLPTDVKKINHDSMRFLALLYKINTQIPSICEYNDKFHFILINVEALNQLQKIVHPSESIVPTPVMGPISTRMIRAYDEIPWTIKTKNELSTGQQLLSFLFPHSQHLKQACRPVELRHPDINYFSKPHGYSTHPFLLSWHDLFHSWRSGCHYKTILRQCRLIFDEKAGLARYPTIMSKIIWKLTDMDFGFSAGFRLEKHRYNKESQLEYFLNVIFWFFFSSSQHEDTILFMYNFVKPGNFQLTSFLDINLQQLEFYLKLSFYSKVPDLHDNLNFLIYYQEHIRKYLKAHPNAHFMQVYLFSILEPKYPLHTNIIEYFNTHGYENCFEWTKNDGIHFSEEWYPTLKQFGLRKKVSDNEIEVLHSGLMARVGHDNLVREDSKPF